MREYEAVVILTPDLEGDALAVASKEATDIITKHKGEIGNIAEWGKRPLGHEISKHKDGIQYFIEFKASPESIKDIKRALFLNSNVLNSMISLRTAKKIK